MFYDLHVFRETIYKLANILQIIVNASKKKKKKNNDED